MSRAGSKQLQKPLSLWPCRGQFIVASMHLLQVASMQLLQVLERIVVAHCLLGTCLQLLKRPATVSFPLLNMMTAVLAQVRIGGSVQLSRC